MKQNVKTNTMHIKILSKLKQKSWHLLNKIIGKTNDKSNIPQAIDGKK